MIAKISTGSYTAGMVRYNHDKTKSSKISKKDAELIGTKNIITPTFEAIVSIIEDYNNKNTRIKKPNIHISLNFYKDDLIENEKILEIANDYMAEMGFEDQPYAVYRHFDREHPHIHIVSSMINSEGKKINDSHIYYRSQALTRELEEKYKITKAIFKRGVLEESNIHKAIYEHLEHGKHSLTSILNEALFTVLDSKPTSEKEFDRLLESYQVKRFISLDKNKNAKGHYFDLYPLEYLNEEKAFKKSKGIEGIAIDVNYSYESIQVQLRLNEQGKELFQKKIMGKVYSVLNPIINNYSENKLENSNPIKLSELRLQLIKKGIKLTTKRSQTGENSNSIYGLLFKDINTKYIYSASEFKLKTNDFLKYLEDDEKRIIEDEITEKHFFEKEEKPTAITSESKSDINAAIHFFNMLDNLLSGNYVAIEDHEDTRKKKRKKPKR